MATTQKGKGGRFVSSQYDPKAVISNSDKLFFTNYDREIKEENPSLYNGLEEIAVKSYFESVNLKTHKPKRGVNAGERIYKKLFDYVKDEIWTMKYSHRRGEKRLRRMCQEDLGFTQNTLEGLFYQGPITLRQFEDTIARPTSDRLGNLLNELSTETLNEDLLNDGVKNYLVKEAKKVGLRKIKPENIVTVEDLRVIIGKIVKAGINIKREQEDLFSKLTKPSLN